MKLVIMWKRLGERVTGLRYPQNDCILGFGGIVRKTVLDMVAISVPFAAYAAMSLFESEPSELVVSIAFVIAIYLVVFLHWLIGEFLWALFVWNPRARNLKRATRGLDKGASALRGRCRKEAADRGAAA